jgi:hypothetical protein
MDTGAGTGVASERLRTQDYPDLSRSITTIEILYIRVLCDPCGRMLYHSHVVDASCLQPQAIRTCADTAAR